MIPIHFNLYYSNRCRFCIIPKQEFLKFKKTVVIDNKFIVHFNMIDVEKMTDQERIRVPIFKTPTYYMFIAFPGQNAVNTFEYVGIPNQNYIIQMLRQNLV